MMTPGQHEAGDKALHVLIVSRDASLEDEFRAAVASVPDTHAVLHYADTYRQALEIARGRQPDLVLIEVDRPVAEVAGLAKELGESVPGTAIAAAFKRDQLEQEQSESGAIIELLRAQVRDFLRRPLAATELRTVLERLLARAPAAIDSDRGRVLSFLSNKGGVGKSTLAVNVAVALATRHPEEVLLIDASLQGGACALLLDLKPATGIVDAVRQRDRLDATLLRHLTVRHASSLRVLAAPADALEGAEVDDETIARILHMARRSFRYVIVDTFAMIDNVVMTILDLTDLAFVVVQAMAPSVAGVARLLPVLEGLGFPRARQRLVLNYNYQPFLGDLAPRDVADQLQRTIDYVVRYEKRLLASANTGSPQILHAKSWHRFRRAIDQVVDDLAGAAAAGSPAADTPEVSDEKRARLGSDRRRSLPTNV